MYTRKNILQGVKKSWLNIIDNNELKLIINNLNKESEQCFPVCENIFETFKYFEVKETKLVILGQDPYHNIKNNIPQANGLAFSVNENYQVPPSLKNIYKELKLEYKDFVIPKNGNLINWVKKEKIILLNSALTVKAHKANSHSKLWKNYTDNIIKYISDNVDNIIFILLGNFAKTKIKFINQNKIKYNLVNIITAPHPSPLSANKGFFGSNIFITSNKYLEKINSLKKLYFTFIVKSNRLNYNIIRIICEQIKDLKINWINLK